MASSLFELETLEALLGMCVVPLSFSFTVFDCFLLKYLVVLHRHKYKYFALLTHNAELFVKSNSAFDACTVFGPARQSVQIVLYIRGT